MCKKKQKKTESIRLHAGRKRSILLHPVSKNIAGCVFPETTGVFVKHVPGVYPVSKLLKSRINCKQNKKKKTWHWNKNQTNFSQACSLQTTTSHPAREWETVSQSVSQSVSWSISHKGEQTLLCWPKQKGHPTSYPQPGVAQIFCVRAAVPDSALGCAALMMTEMAEGALVTDHRTVIPSMLRLQSALLQTIT